MNNQAMEQDSQTALLRDRYTAALLSGDDEEAHRVVRDAIDRGIEPASIYFGIFGPALVEVGHSWRMGELNIAEEHLATSTTLRQIGHVSEVWRDKRKRDTGAKAVAAAVEGEMHSVGVRMVADLLHMDGWSVADLGQNNPTGDLVELVEERKPDLVILSLSSPARIGAASEAASRLKALDGAPAVFVGGTGISHAEQDEIIAADFASSNPLEALRAARQLLDPSRERVPLEAHLNALGRRILELRKERGWSQQELATRASLDRTYISTVEQGKQNITIGAAVKIADALETSLSRMIDYD